MDIPDGLRNQLIQCRGERQMWDEVWKFYLEKIFSEDPEPNGCFPEHRDLQSLINTIISECRGTSTNFFAGDLRQRPKVAATHCKLTVSRYVEPGEDEYFPEDFRTTLRGDICPRVVLMCSVSQDSQHMGKLETNSKYDPPPTGTGKLKGVRQNSEPAHAEIQMIQEVEPLIMDNNDGTWELTVYISASPCHECAAQIQKFSKEYKVKIIIICSSLYNMCQEENRQGLRDLKESGRVTLRIFADEDWHQLNEVYRAFNASAGLEPLTFGSLIP